MDLYRQLGVELRSLLQDLFYPSLRDTVKAKMDHILFKAAQIGGTIEKDAKTFAEDLARFLEKPYDPQALAIMKKHALKLELETREL